MKLHTMLPAIACALCFGFAAGQEAGAADQAMPPMGGMQGGMDMSKAGQASFDKMDADKDGKVSQEEFLKAHPGMKPEAFARIDKNGDKVITSEEWGQFMVGHSSMGGGQGGSPMGGMGMPPAGMPQSGSMPPSGEMPMVMPPSGKVDTAHGTDYKKPPLPLEPGRAAFSQHKKRRVA